MLELISKLSFTKGLNIVLILFGCIAGPFSFLYCYYQSLYMNNEFSKTLMLSAAVGVPVCLVMSTFNAVILGIPGLKDEKQRMEWILSIMGFTSGFCGFVFYSACIAHWLLQVLSPRHGIEIVLFIFGGAVLYSIFYFIKAKFNKNRSK